MSVSSKRLRSRVTRPSPVRTSRDGKRKGAVPIWRKGHDGDDRVEVERTIDMRKELVATLNLLIPHRGVKSVDRNAQDYEFRHAAKKRVGHTGDLFFESAMHEAHLG